VGRVVLPGLVALGLVAASLWPGQAVGAGPAVAASTDEPESDQRSCAATAPGEARCHARVRTDSKVRGKAPLRRGESPPAGVPALGTLGNGGAYDPSYLQSAYNLVSAASTAGAGQIVAIVDAFDDPAAEADLAMYRSHFGLPACTSASGCFRKLNQTGAASPLPSVDGGWWMGARDLG
jgi:hypothetical protein